MIDWLERNKIIVVIITLFITIEIFYISSMQGGAPGVGGQSIWVSRAYHFTVFFLFSFFLLATIKGNKKIETKHLLMVLFISLAHAFLDEFHQSFIPFRDASIRDIMTNSLGIFSSIIFYLFIDKKQRKINQSLPSK